jgi:hypothetical protein
MPQSQHSLIPIMVILRTKNDKQLIQETTLVKQFHLIAKENLMNTIQWQVTTIMQLEAKIHLVNTKHPSSFSAVNSFTGGFRSV